MRLRTLAVVGVLGLLAGPGGARAADQTTQYRVDRQHSNAVPDSSLQPPLKLRWQANHGGVASNVVVAEGRVDDDALRRPVVRPGRPDPPRE